MFEIAVSTEFCAAHALTIGGQRETLHGHNWKVVATIAGRTLDSDGLLCDFHTVEETLAAIIEPFDNNDLNKISPFDAVNPSAENVARHIAEQLSARLDEVLAPHAAVAWVSVSEAPGCVATFRCGGPGAHGVNR